MVLWASPNMVWLYSKWTHTSGYSASSVDDQGPHLDSAPRKKDASLTRLSVHKQKSHSTSPWNMQNHAKSATGLQKEVLVDEVHIEAVDKHQDLSASVPSWSTWMVTHGDCSAWKSQSETETQPNKINTGSMIHGKINRTGDQGSALNALFWDTSLAKHSLHWQNHWTQSINFFNVVCTKLFCFAVCTMLFCLGIQLTLQNQQKIKRDKKTTLCLNQSWTSIDLFFLFVFFWVSVIDNCLRIQFQVLCGYGTYPNLHSSQKV